MARPGSSRSGVPGRLVGYARVSTEEQGTDPQRDELHAAGCAAILEEHASGADRSRPVLARLLRDIRPGDTLVVVRLARSVGHLLAVIEQLEASGAHFRSLRNPIDTSTPQGMFSLHVLGAVAQLERALIAERTKAGLHAARARGRVGGNPGLRAGDPAAIRKLRASRDAKHLDGVLAQLDTWLPTVRRMRPGQPWGDVVRVLNHRRVAPTVGVEHHRRRDEVQPHPARALSRLCWFAPRMAKGRPLGVDEVIWHGGSVLVGCERGASRGLAGVGWGCGARRSGPGTGGAADACGLDGLRDWRSVQCRGGRGAALAGMVRARRHRCVALDPGAPRPSPERGERALACARELLAAPVQDRPNWTLPRLRARANRHGDFAEIEAHGRARGAVASERVAAKGGFRRRRPRHSLTRRQDAREVERVGLRLQLRRAQAEAGDIVLLYGDESEALTHPYLAHAWAERGADLRVQAPRRNAQRLRLGQAHKVAILGVLDAMTRLALVHTSPTKRSSNFLALLEQLDRAYGPVPGQTRKPVVLVLDNGPIHTSKATTKALTARPWITVDWLPRCAPELNLIEATWRDLKRHHLAHRTFRDTDDLDQAIHQAMAALNKERSSLHPCHNLPKAA